AGGVLWHPDAVLHLRTQLRVVGSLVGGLVQAPQQNDFHGLPLLLMPEQVALLVHLDACDVVDDARAHTPPTAAQLAAWSASVAADMREYAAARQAYAERMKLLHKTRDPALDRPSEPAIAPLAPLLPVSVPTSSDGLPWYTPPPDHMEQLRGTIPSTLTARSFTAEPLASHTQRWTAFQRSRYAVFLHFWHAGWYIAPGTKFGGDFLLYADDPVECHASHVVKVLDSPAVTICGLDVVRAGRLATIANKTFVYCAWDAASGLVETLEIKWSK
ncbi:hypothetical protein BC831DRAFT_445923, partial [Entophlyctis helioformis]